MTVCLEDQDGLADVSLRLNDQCPGLFSPWLTRGMSMKP